MSGPCVPFDPLGAYVKSVIGFTDCQAGVIAETGYRAFGAGTGFGMALTGLLVVMVALFGYRLMLGGGVTLRDGVVALVRIGIVLALAQQWPAYQALVYDVATRAPGELAGAMLGKTSLAAADGRTLVDRVQAVDTTLGTIVHPEIEVAVPGAAAPSLPAGAGTAQRVPISEFAPETRDALAGAERISVLAFLTGTVGAKAAVALLLALGPLFIAMLLFDVARGFFAGWVRALGAAILGAIAVPVITALELALIEPQVVALQRAVATGQALHALPEQLWVTVALFAAVLAVAIIAVARAAAVVHWPARWPQVVSRWIAAPGGPAPVRLLTYQGSTAPAPERSHAQRVADAATALARRETLVTATGAPRPIGPANSREPARAAIGPSERLGQAARAGAGRQSAAAARRDGS